MARKRQTTGGREGWDLVGLRDAAKLVKGFSSVNPTKPQDNLILRLVI